MNEFKERLKESRKIKKISQKQLANIIGTNNSSVCDWECGRTEPNIEMILKLAIYFDVTTDYLLGLENEDGSKCIKKF